VLRRDLIKEVGGDLSLPVLKTRILGSEEAWIAFSSFCESVMLRKEEAERICRNEAAIVVDDDREGDTDGEGEEDTPPLSSPIRSRRARNVARGGSSSTNGR